MTGPIGGLPFASYLAYLGLPKWFLLTINWVPETSLQLLKVRPLQDRGMHDRLRVVDLGITLVSTAEAHYSDWRLRN